MVCVFFLIIQLCEQCLLVTQNRHETKQEKKIQFSSDQWNGIREKKTVFIFNISWILTDN